MLENYDPNAVENTLLNAQRDQMRAYDKAIENQQDSSVRSNSLIYSLPANSMGEQLYNLKNKDPNAYRKQQLQVASERAKNILDGDAMKDRQEREHLLSLGFTPEQINERLDEDAKFNALSPEERLQNFIALRNGDPNALDDRKLVQDFAEGDPAVLEAKYGKKIADYAYQENAERFKSLSSYTAQQNTDYSKSEYFTKSQNEPNLPMIVFCLVIIAIILLIPKHLSLRSDRKD